MKTELRTLRSTPITLGAFVLLALPATGFVPCGRVAVPTEVLSVEDRLQTPAADVHTLFGTAERELRDFCRKLPRRLPGEITIGVFPLVFVDRTRPGSLPRVNEAGEMVGDAIARSIRELAGEVDVLGPMDVDLRLADLGSGPTALYRATDVRSHGHILGVDVVLFGLMEKEAVGASTVRRLHFRLGAVDIGRGRELGQMTWSVPSNTGSMRELWLALNRGSRWDAGSAVEVSHGASLDLEMNTVRRVLAARIKRQVTDEDFTRGEVVLVTPVMASEFVPALAEMQRAAAELEKEEKRRLDAAIERGTALDRSSPVKIGDRTLSDLDAAIDYVLELDARLTEMPVAKYCDGVSLQVRDALRPWNPSRVLGAHESLSAAQMRKVRSWLVTGTLSENVPAQSILRNNGVVLVIAPRLQRLGDHFALEARVFDLAEPERIRTARAAIDRRFSAELARELDVDVARMRSSY